MKKVIRKNAIVPLLFLLLSFIPLSLLSGCPEGPPDPSLNGVYTWYEDNCGNPWICPGGLIVAVSDLKHKVLWSQGGSYISSATGVLPNGTQFTTGSLYFGAACIGYEDSNGKITSFCYNKNVSNLLTHGILTFTPIGTYEDPDGRDNNYCKIALEIDGVFFFQEEGQGGWGIMKPVFPFIFHRPPYDEDSIFSCHNIIPSYFYPCICPNLFDSTYCEEIYGECSYSSSSSSASMSTPSDDEFHSTFNQETLIDISNSVSILNDLTLMASGDSPMYDEMKDKYLNGAWDQWIARENQLGDVSPLDLLEVRQKLGEEVFNR